MKITFMIINDQETRIRLMHENEYVPYRRRTVTIELTPEQEKALRVTKIGVDCGTVKYEQIVDCFIENEVKDHG